MKIMVTRELAGYFRMKVVKLQTERDSLIQHLIGEMDESCNVAQDAAPLRDESKRSGEIVVKILMQVIQCTYFVKEYCSEWLFGMHENTSIQTSYHPLTVCSTVEGHSFPC